MRARKFFSGCSLLFGHGLSGRWLGSCWLGSFAMLLGLASLARAQEGYERPPIDYYNTQVHDAVAELSERLDSQQQTLDYAQGTGYLPALLQALDISPNSQTLVFSKTSLQLHRISPRRPRALYFNDDVYVGYCQGGDVLEIAATDAKQGAMFYTMQQSADGRPKLIRDRGQCLTCHATHRTQSVPGYILRSVFPDRSGQPLLSSGTFNTSHSSPFAERWGGWYVTGSHANMRHMGNQIFTSENARSADVATGANLATLDELVSTQPYLSPHSDLVALLVLGHQTQMHNAIAAANYETRLALHQSFQMNEVLGREEGFISDSAQRRIEAVAENVVEHLLGWEEAKLDGPVAGTSPFADEFQARGIRDSKGRSLRDLELQSRVFLYPCSYLIYNGAFDGLPDEVRKRIITRLVAILSGREAADKYAHLTAATRNSIFEILRETKPEFRDLSHAIDP